MRVSFLSSSALSSPAWGSLMSQIQGPRKGDKRKIVLFTQTNNCVFKLSFTKYLFLLSTWPKEVASSEPSPQAVR